MNIGQKMFKEFFMSIVKDECKEEAEQVLAESFEKQANGTFDVAYLTKMTPKYISLVKEESIDQLKKAMESFASKF